MSKIVQLPGTPLTPAVLLHETLERLGEIKSAVLVVTLDDGTTECQWSDMTMEQICFAGHVLQATIIRAFEEDE